MQLTEVPAYVHFFPCRGECFSPTVMLVALVSLSCLPLSEAPLQRPQGSL